MPEPGVVVIGAGIAGLTAASILQRHGHQVTVLERAPRVGGRIRTEGVGGHRVDVGAEYVTDAHRHTRDLLSELGMAGQLRPVPLDIALLDGGLPERLALRSFFAGRHLSPTAQAALVRAYLTVLRHRHELSFSDMTRAHRLDTATTASLFPAWGQDAVTRFLNPMMRAFLFSGPSRTSRAVMLAYLRLLLGLRAVDTLDGGLERLPGRLAATLDVRLGHEAVSVFEGPLPADGNASAYRVDVHPPAGRRPYSLDADAVVCATTASAAARLLRPTGPPVQKALSTVRYASAAVLNCDLTVKVSSPARWVIDMGRRDTAVAIMRIVPGDVSDVLTLWSPGGPTGALLCDSSDEDVLHRMTGARASETLLPQGRSAIRSFRVDRWPEALPEFPVGHLARIRQVTAALPGGLTLAGDYLGGQNIEAAIVSGRTAARVTLGHLAH
ncbi:protoporphyrinogen/coproporphyrinogen oxidase [Streptomyces sp. NPDC004126]|uniref:protoporphyrinogen/coproporphyrinogen oxidase n=1 Tax=Streptomyces sp. NPDC004126 TaxID=3390695 RepID=UPI003D07DA41